MSTRFYLRARVLNSNEIPQAVDRMKYTMANWFGVGLPEYEYNQLLIHLIRALPFTHCGHSSQQSTEQFHTAPIP